MIRTALPDDFDAIVRLYRQLQPADPILTNGSDRVAFDLILGTPGLTLFVLLQGGEVAGTTYLNVIPNITRRARPYALIENVVVEESLRGTGIGTQLIAATLEAAWAAGCYKAMLLTGSQRASTHAFYRNAGFSSTEKVAFLARPPGP